MKGPVNLQDTFLNQLRKENMPTTVFLVNGYQLKGVIRSFDQFTVLIEVEGSSSWSISMPSPRQSPCGISACRSLTKAIRQRFNQGRKNYQFKKDTLRAGVFFYFSLFSHFILPGRILVRLQERREQDVLACQTALSACRAAALPAD